MEFSVLLVVCWLEKKSKTYASYSLVGLGYYVVTGKIITSSNNLITSRVKFF